MNCRISFLLIISALLLASRCFAQDVVGSPDDKAASQSGATVEVVEDTSAVPEIPDTIEPTSKYRIYKQHRDYSALLETSEGTLCCDLFVDDHPLTVLNFRALAIGRPGWTDSDGNMHLSPYYENLPFEQGEKNAFAVISERQEGTGFVIEDERCDIHEPVAGSLVMVQPHPGAASAKFALLVKKLPEMRHMFPVFGQCHDIELIKKLSSSKATLLNVRVIDNVACTK